MPRPPSLTVHLDPIADSNGETVTSPARAVARDIAAVRRLCRQRGRPVLDVGRRAIADVAAEIPTRLRPPTVADSA